ncbi:MAG: ATP-binding protein [Euryarchaeota archaeon]|nr:ATP-binding protein [Euryarchaeota archaeon]
MNLNELAVRLIKGEDLHTEFKERLIHADDLAASIIAFANTDGGQMIFGVDDSGQTTGLGDETDHVLQFIDNIAFNNCEPPVTIVQETVRDPQGRIVVIANILKGDHRPYRTNQGVYYVRTASGRRQASREELLRMFQSTESFYYDETSVFQSSTEDLDDKAIERLLKDITEQGFDIAGISGERLIVNWHLVRETKTDGRVHPTPTLTGIIFLASHPQQFLPYAYVSALRIPGTDISAEPYDQKHIEGRMVDILHDVMRFLDIHLMRPHKIVGLLPEARPELPVVTLRESLVNALAHRDYTISAPVRVIVFDDRVEIRTPGKLPNTVTIESMRWGVHVLRNPTIYNVFLKLGFVTDAGSGIPRMIRIFRDATGKEPILRMEGNEFVTAFPRSSML